MGSGFTFFENAFDVTPAAGSWQDVDVSSYVPAGATCAVLDVHQGSGGSNKISVRRNGSSVDDSASGWITGGRHAYAVVKLDGEGIFEAYVAYSSGPPKVWLVGYGDENVVVFDDYVDYSTSTVQAWVDADVGGDVPSGATGVIVKMINTDSSVRRGLVRNNGAAETRQNSSNIRNTGWIYYLCGVDDSRVFEQYVDTVGVKLKLVGYTKPPITFKVDADDVSLGTTGVFTDVYVTSVTEAAADGAIMFIVNTSGSDYPGEVRKNGSTDDRTADAKVHFNGQTIALVGLDSGQVLEGYVGSNAVDFWLVGYCKPAAGGQVYEISVDAVAESSAGEAEECTFNIQKDAISRSDSLRGSETTFNVSKDVIIKALSDCGLESLFSVLKDAVGQVSAAVSMEQLKEVFKDASVQAVTTQQVESVLGVGRNASVMVDVTRLVQSMFNLSSDAAVKVLSEVSVVKEGEVKVTRLFLVFGNLAVQIQGD
jgi:hypothetical protein